MVVGESALTVGKLKTLLGTNDQARVRLWIGDQRYKVTGTGTKQGSPGVFLLCDEDPPRIRPPRRSPPPHIG